MKNTSKNSITIKELKDIDPTKIQSISLLDGNVILINNSESSPNKQNTIGKIRPLFTDIGQSQTQSKNEYSVQTEGSQKCSRCHRIISQPIENSQTTDYQNYQYYEQGENLSQNKNIKDEGVLGEGQQLLKNVNGQLLNDMITYKEQDQEGIDYYGDEQGVEQAQEQGEYYINGEEGYSQPENVYDYEGQEIQTDDYYMNQQEYGQNVEGIEQGEFYQQGHEGYQEGMIKQENHYGECEEEHKGEEKQYEEINSDLPKITVEEVIKMEVKEVDEKKEIEDEQKEEPKEEQKEEQKDEQKEEQKDEQKEGQKEELKEEPKEEQKEEQKEKQKEEPKEEQNELQKEEKNDEKQEEQKEENNVIEKKENEEEKTLPEVKNIVEEKENIEKREEKEQQNENTEKNEEQHKKEKIENHENIQEKQPQIEEKNPEEYKESEYKGDEKAEAEVYEEIKKKEKKPDKKIKQKLEKKEHKANVNSQRPRVPITKIEYVEYVLPKRTINNFPTFPAKPLLEQEARRNMEQRSHSHSQTFRPIFRTEMLSEMLPSMPRPLFRPRIGVIGIPPRPPLMSPLPPFDIIKDQREYIQTMPRGFPYVPQPRPPIYHIPPRPHLRPPIHQLPHGPQPRPPIHHMPHGPQYGHFPLPPKNQYISQGFQTYHIPQRPASRIDSYFNLERRFFEGNEGEQFSKFPQPYPHPYPYQRYAYPQSHRRFEEFYDNYEPEEAFNRTNYFVEKNTKDQEGDEFGYDEKNYFSYTMGRPRRIMTTRSVSQGRNFGRLTFNLGQTKPRRMFKRIVKRKFGKIQNTNNENFGNVTQTANYQSGYNSPTRKVHSFQVKSTRK